MNISDSLRPHELINVAVASMRFVDIIRRHYLIANYRIDTQTIRITDVGTVYVRSLNDVDRDIYLGDRAISILQLFGDLFHRVTFVTERFGETEVMKLLQRIHEYCRNVEIHVMIEAHRHLTTNLQNITFDKVLSAHLDSVEIAQGIPLHELFPRLQRIEIRRVYAISFLSHRFPHLTELILNTVFSPSWIPKLLEFYRLNPTIEKLTTPTFPNNHSYMAYINDMLPKLNTLSIKYISHHYPNNRIDDPIHFRIVKHFSLETSDFDRDQPPGQFNHKFMKNVS